MMTLFYIDYSGRDRISFGKEPSIPYRYWLLSNEFRNQFILFNDSG
ncbi:hypothetical protein [Myroides profundi]|nr:hypothetical protein [Myroides profundi]AJH13590.1 hypothetical protein MPR_0378 [Myroides profundi]